MSGRKEPPSRAKFEKALFELLNEHPFSSISVSDICRKAGLSRQSFYLSYRDIDDVLAHVIMRLFNDIMNSVEVHNVDSSEKLIAEYTNIVEAHAEEFKALADREMSGKLGAVLVEELVQHPTMPGCNREIIEPTEKYYFNAFWVAGFVEVYTKWLSEDMKTDKNELNRILLDIMSGQYFKK